MFKVHTEFHIIGDRVRALFMQSDCPDHEFTSLPEC